MNLGNLMAKNEFTAKLFGFVSEGVEFSVVAKQTPGNIKTGRVSILLKTVGEKPVVLTMLDEQFDVERAIEFVKDECLCVEC